MDRRTRTLAALSLLSLIVLFVNPANAQSSGYFGAGFGWTRADLGDVEDTADSVDDESMALRLFAGYRPFRVLAIEIFYEDLTSYVATTGTTSVERETDTYGAAVLGFIPIGGHAELFVKVGVSRWDTEAEIDDAGTPIARGRRKASEPVYGIGLNLTSSNNPAAGIRLEYERYLDVGQVPGIVDGADIDSFTVNVIYNF